MNPNKVLTPLYISIALLWTFYWWIFLPILGAAAASAKEIIGMAIYTFFFWAVALVWSLYCDYEEDAERRGKMFLSRMQGNDEQPVEKKEPSLYRMMFGYPRRSNFKSVLKDMPNILIEYMKEISHRR